MPKLTLQEIVKANPRYKLTDWYHNLFDTQENRYLGYFEQFELQNGKPLSHPSSIEKGLALSDLEQQLLDDIRQGKSVTSNGDKMRTNALTKLRRKHLIKNKGTRSRPIWTFVSDANPYYDV